MHQPTCGPNEVCMRLLIEQRADLNFRDSLGCTALHRAGIGDNSEGLQILLEANQ